MVCLITQAILQRGITLAEAARTIGETRDRLDNVKRGTVKADAAELARQITAGTRPKEGERRCKCCSKIKQVEMFDNRLRNDGRRCKQCASGGHTHATYSILDKILPPPEISIRAAIGNAEAEYKRPYPILLHVAYRANRVASSAIAKRLGVCPNKVKRWATAMGLTKPGVRVCATMTPSEGLAKRSRHEMAESHRLETRQSRRATAKVSWCQHPEYVRHNARAYYNGLNPGQKQIVAQRAMERQRKIREANPKPPRAYSTYSKANAKIGERIRDATRDIYKNGSARYSHRIGCTGAQLREWLECQFTGNMRHENYGRRWNIDHVAPLSSFDLSNDDEAMMAANFNNLKPMYSRKNFSKGSTTNGQMPLTLQLP